MKITYPEYLSKIDNLTENDKKIKIINGLLGCGFSLTNVQTDILFLYAL